MYIQMSDNAKKILSLVILLAWLSLIFMLSAQGGLAARGNPPLSFYLERKGAHVFEYFVLALLFLWTLRVFFPKGMIGMAIIIAAELSLLYAFTDELHQTFVPGREGKLSDVAIDSIGITLALIGYALWRRYRKNQGGSA